jgi:hypothetical protein
MTKNGDYELSDVPGLLDSFRDSGNPHDAFKARAGLLNECDRLMLCAHRESRGLTVDERQSFDEHMEKIRELSGFLAEIRKQQVAEITAQGFPPEYCRSPY